MTITTPQLFLIEGQGERCLGCSTFIAVPNIPTLILRDGNPWGFTHTGCAAPWLLRMMLNAPSHIYTKGN